MWCQQWQVSQPKETGAASPQDMLMKQRVCVFGSQFLFFTCGKQKPDIVISLYLLWMCDVCWSSHVNNMSRLSSAICAAGKTTRSRVHKRRTPPLVSLCTHMSALPASHPSGFCPQMTRLGQKLPLQGKHAHTVNLKRLITTQKWLVPDLIKHRCDS